MKLRDTSRMYPREQLFFYSENTRKFWGVHQLVWREAMHDLEAPLGYQSGGRPVSVSPGIMFPVRDPVLAVVFAVLPLVKLSPALQILRES